MGPEKNYEDKIKSYLKDLNVYFLKHFGNAFTRSGIPDLIACVNGFFMAVEVKAAGGRASMLQLHNISKIRKMGGIAFVLYPDKFDEFKKIVGLLREKQHTQAYLMQYNFDNAG